jgi:hypothetical protein
MASSTSLQRKWPKDQILLDSKCEACNYKYVSLVVVVVVPQGLMMEAVRTLKRRSTPMRLHAKIL